MERFAWDLSFVRDSLHAAIGHRSLFTREVGKKNKYFQIADSTPEAKKARVDVEATSATLKVL